MKIKGLRLWKVGIRGQSSSLLITGPLKDVTRKAVKVAKAEFGVARPDIVSIKSRGTLDA